MAKSAADPSIWLTKLASAVTTRLMVSILLWNLGAAQAGGVVLDRMRQVIVARAFRYADDPVGATGMMVKDRRVSTCLRHIEI